jgi:carboxymethylenebutenolidase
MELVRIPTPSGTMKAVLAAPREEGRRPIVILIHEIFGLNGDIREKAQRFADNGYLALAPDLYSTRGRAPLCVLRTMRGLKGGHGAVFEDLAACRSWVGARAEADPERVGVIGFCMGGGIALLMAATSGIQAAGVFYGEVPRQAAALAESCPVVGGFGARDRFFGKNGRRLGGQLKELGIEHDVETYPDAGHSYLSDHTGFFARLNAVGPMHVGFNPTAAEDSWRRVDAFFERHLRTDEIPAQDQPAP